MRPVRGALVLGSHLFLFAVHTRPNTDDDPDETYDVSILDVPSNHSLLLAVQGAGSIDLLLDMISNNDFFTQSIVHRDFSIKAELGYFTHEGKTHYIDVKQQQGSWSLIFRSHQREDSVDMDDGGAGQISHPSVLSLSAVAKLKNKGRLVQAHRDTLVTSDASSSSKAPALDLPRGAVDLNHLPRYALVNPAGLIKAIRLASCHQPIDAEYTRSVYDPRAHHQQSHIVPALANKHIKSFKHSEALGFHKEESIGSVVPVSEAFAKQACLKDFRTKGYASAENLFRSSWECKLKQIEHYFSSKRAIQKAINSVRRQANVSHDEAFLSLAFCDGSTAEALSRLIGSNALKSDMAMVLKMFPVRSIIDHIMESYIAPVNSLPPLLPQTTTKHRVAPLGVMTIATHRRTKLELLNAGAAAKLEPMDTDTPLGKSVTRYKRFSLEIDAKLRLSSSLGVLSLAKSIKEEEKDLWREIRKEKHKKIEHASCSSVSES